MSEATTSSVIGEEAMPGQTSAGDTVDMPKDADTTTVNATGQAGADRQYYTIGEVAELFKVKTSHIRFWTNEFGIKVRTTRKGDRLYTPEQIRELKVIYHLVKERGFTLAGAKAKMKGQNNLEKESVDLKQSLQQLRNKLVNIRNQI